MKLYEVWHNDSALAFRIAAATPPRVRNVRTTDRYDSVAVRSATPELFSVLGVGPALGHTFPQSM